MRPKIRSHIEIAIFVRCWGKKLASSNGRWGIIFQAASLMAILLLLTPTSSISSQQDMVEAEYQVYSDYLNGLTKKERGALVVIDDHTWSYDYDEPSWNTVNAKIRSKFVDVSQETLDDFYRKNGKGKNVPLAPRFNIKVKHVLLRDPPNKIREDYIKGENGWNNFYRKYPGAKGLVTFSRVGFNRGMDEALVHLVVQSGLDSGSNFFALLRKQKGIWRIISTLTMSQS